MKKLLLLLLILSTTLNAQNHGTGGGTDTIGNKDDDLLAVEKCREVVDLGEELVSKFNNYHKTNKSIKSYKEFVEIITTVAYKIKFNELKNASEQKIRVKCGDKYINKILAENPWLKDKEIHTLFGKINNKDATLGCYGFDPQEIDTYLKFLEIWTKQESPKMTPVEEIELINNPAQYGSG